MRIMIKEKNEFLELTEKILKTHKRLVRNLRKLTPELKILLNEAGKVKNTKWDIDEAIRESELILYKLLM
jgi:hypothetical protein